MARKARRGVSTSGEAAGTQETITAGPLSLLGMLSSYNTYSAWLRRFSVCKNITLYKGYEQSKTPSVHNTDYHFFSFAPSSCRDAVVQWGFAFLLYERGSQKAQGRGWKVVKFIQFAKNTKFCF